MFQRVLFLLLLAANVGVAAWLWFAPPEAPTLLPVADPGVPVLTLLSERAGAVSNSAELAEAPMPEATRQSLRCTSLGPFPTQADLRRAMNVLTPLTEQIQFRETRSVRSRGYWVYLPAFASRDQALSTARDLSGRGIRDYYVVTAGDQENTVSLGLFRERANADRRLAEIRALGFAAQMHERTDEAPEYWLDYAVLPEQSFDWRDRVPDRLELQGQEVACPNP